jgi:hypothetical protein
MSTTATEPAAMPGAPMPPPQPPPVDAGAGDATGSGGARGPGAGDAAGEQIDTAPSVSAAVISFDNLVEGETLPHALAVIAGSVTGAAVTSVELNLGGRTSRWPVIAGHFRALAQLAPGPNALTFTAGTAAPTTTTTTTTLHLAHVPSDNPRFIRFLYVVAADGDGSFEGAPGEPHDQVSALARLRVDARLVQTFLAETMRQAGFGRLTFRLPVDATGEPVVEIWRSKLTNAQARAMDGNALWNAIYRELERLPDRDLSLDVAVMAMTHYVPASQTMQAHTALGGGRLGLFGSGTLFAHAAALDDITRAFTDARTIDRSQLPDDSAGRNTRWANYATGIGAMAHELGHALSLPHPSSHAGLMWRGFDHFNRTFAIAEPGSAQSAGLAPVLAQNESGIDRSNAVRLRYHRWLGPGRVPYVPVQPPQITVQGAGVQISSPAGIRHIQYLVAGQAVTHDEFLDEAPPVVTVQTSVLRSRLPAATEVEVTTIDDDGNIASGGRISLR